MENMKQLGCQRYVPVSLFVIVFTAIKDFDGCKPLQTNIDWSDNGCEGGRTDGCLAGLCISIEQGSVATRRTPICANCSWLKRFQLRSSFLGSRALQVRK